MFERLEGAWKSRLGGYEFVKSGTNFTVTQYGAVGKTGSGIAQISGNSVTMEMTNIVAGRNVLELTMQGDTLEGHISLMGMKMPMVLTKIG